MAAVNQLMSVDHASHLAGPWLEQCVQPDKLKEVLVQALPRITTERLKELAVFLKACGEGAVPALMETYPALDDARARRALSQLALQVGFNDLRALRPVLMDKNPEVVAEGLFVLSKTPDPNAKKMLEQTKTHPEASVRLSLLTAGVFDENESLRLAVGFLHDSDSRVQVAAANKLGEYKGDRRAISELSHAVSTGAILESRNEVKDAVLMNLAALAKDGALKTIADAIRSGEGRRASPEAQALAVSAVKSMKHLRSGDAAQVLKKALGSGNPRIRNTAKDTINYLKRGQRGR